MATSLSIHQNLILSPFPNRTDIQTPLFTRTHFGLKPFLRGSICVAKFGLRPDPNSADGVKELLGVAERLLFTLADAAVSSSDAVTTTKQNSDWLSGITNVMETVLKVLKDGMSTLHVPYAYGFAIILLTVIVKAATFPLTKKQVESSMAMRSLAPQVKAIQERYAGDQERIQLETARLYKLAGINPLAGCLPTLATIPVWIGLYRALSNVADEDGHPPLGWSDTFAYLVLPVLLVVSQYISVKIIQSSQNLGEVSKPFLPLYAVSRIHNDQIENNDPNMKSSQALTNFLPLMIGYFALSVPSGLSLYWFTNNLLSTAQQVWLQKFGGAKDPMKQFSDIIKDERLDINKSVPGLSSTKKEARQAEKLTTEGPRPGEKFKQIREQEARRRQQREEEKRKAAEAAAKGNQTINGEQEREASILGSAKGVQTDLVDKDDENFPSVTGDNASNIGVAINGNISSHEFKENQDTISVFRTGDNEVSANSEVDGRNEQQSQENLGKEGLEVHARSATTDDKLSEEETHEARRQQ
ncbi:ALBINO3-like protein 1 [Citrus sinensis]|uniref:ALBINO3-like protein 1 n=1 Tax=Citrus sinensis TaxID=2711 RepID=A0ACB8LHS4_CITSI|nr:ALBINO3-like protein 1 [Citrus sinensis]